jgi:hypothetical protein
MRQLGPVVLAFLIAGGLLVKGNATSSDPAAEPVPQGASPEPKAEPMCPGPLPTVNAYLHGRSPPDQRIAPARPDHRPADTVDPVLPDHAVALVAAVPDPVSSGLDYQFDQVVTAIQLAAGTLRYAHVTSWVPWVNGKLANPVVRAGMECARKEPGVLIFRRQTSVLLVFLVGEAPTYGVHPDALERALRLARDVCRREGGESEAVRILGPSFSGSALGMGRVLARRGDLGPFQVVSGSASADSVVADLDSSHVDFRRTIHPFGVLRRSAEQYLEKKLDVPADRITYLTESSTYFGTLIGGLRLPGRCPTCAGTSGRTARSDEVPRSIVFPFHVSDLRRAFDRAVGATGHPQLGGYELPRTTLGIQQDDSNPPVDVVPEFSDSTRNYDEMALTEQIVRACEQRTRAFGIVATDARDKRFLIGRVRSLCPGALTFVFESDLLYTYPGYGAGLTGTLLFSSYPLFPVFDERERNPEAAPAGGEPGAEQPRATAPTAQPGRQEASLVDAPGPKARAPIAPFAASGTIGIYNAAIVLLDATEGMSAAPGRLLEYRCPFDEGTQHPPVWISIAARRELLPVDAVCVGDASELSSATTPSEDVPLHVPKAARGIGLLALAFAAVCISLVARLLWRPVALRQTPWTFALLALLALIMGAFVLLTSAPRHRTPHGLLQLAALLLSRGGICFAFAALCAGAGFAAVVQAWPGLPGLLRRPWVRLPVGMAALGLCLVAAYLVDVGGRAGYERALGSGDTYFFLTRATRLGSGASPALPLLALLAAGLVLVRLQLQRSALLQARLPRPSDGGVPARGWRARLEGWRNPLADRPLFAGLFGGTSSIAVHVDRELRWVLGGGWRPSVVLVLVLVALTCFVCLVPGWTSSVEGRTFDAAFRLGLLVASLVVAAAWARAVMAWQALRTLLGRASRHATLGPALQALGKEVPPQRFANLLSMNPTLRELEISEELLARTTLPGPPWDIACRGECIASGIGRLGVGLLRERTAPWLVPAFEEHQRIAEALARRRCVVWQGDPRPRESSGDDVFIARQLTMLVAWVVAHLRELLLASLAGAILIGLACAAYPFPSGRAMVLLVWGLLLTASGTTIWIVFAFERTEVAAWMAGAEAGRIFDWHLIARVAILAVIPVAAIIAFQFPDAAEWLGRTIDPILSVAR